MSDTAKIDTRVIPDYLNVKLFEKSLQNEFKNDKIKIVDLSIKYATSGGDNYTSDIFRATIKYKSNEDQKVPTDISVIVKSIPSTGAREQILLDYKMYDKELEMYNEVLPILSNLLNGEFLNAKCFYAESTTIATIVFQDLAPLKFRLSDRKAGLDMDHCKLVLSKLAKLHASSMILIENNPEMVDKYFNFGMFGDSVYYEGSQVSKFFDDALSTFPEEIELWGDEYKIYAEKIKKIAVNFRKLIYKCLDNDKIKVKVLNHGDMWVNNLMFKYDDDGKPTETIFVDYQMSYYNSLGYDLNYFLATSPNNDIRISERTNMINYYYECFKGALESLPFTKTLPTLEDIHNEIFYMEFYGFVSCVTVLPIVLAEKMQEETNFEIMLNEDTSDYYRRKNFRSPLYIASMKPILKRLNEIGILDYNQKLC